MASLQTPIDEMMLEALERGDDSLETGRFLVTLKEPARRRAREVLSDMGVQSADSRDFEAQDVQLGTLAGAGAVHFAELGVALVSGPAMAESKLGVMDIGSAQSPIQVVEPEYFAFAEENDFLRGFHRAASAILEGMEGRGEGGTSPGAASVVQGPAVTWGLQACRVPSSPFTGRGIRIAVLDTGMDRHHPEFSNRQFRGSSFVGQPIQDLHGHGTHVIGTSCGPRSPAGPTPRYGIAYEAEIYVGKVLTNSGTAVGGSVLAGMNWAVAQGCHVINLSLGGPVPPQAAYTAAGAAALAAGCLMIAAAGNQPVNTGAPANSPSILSVAALDGSVAPTSWSSRGKVELSGPGEGILSSLPRPRLHGAKSGTSMAAPHVSGCAALWAESDASLRGPKLWRRLEQSARPLPHPSSRVGAGCVQAPQ